MFPYILTSHKTDIGQAGVWVSSCLSFCTLLLRNTCCLLETAVISIAKNNTTMSAPPPAPPPAVPLSRRSSRLTSALTHAKSIDTHPPHHHHHAHFDESAEGQVAMAGPSRSRSGSPSGSRAALRTDVDLEKAEKTIPVPKSVVDIEHVPVDDDPREWSDLKKNLVLTMMTISVVCHIIPWLLYLFGREWADVVAWSID
jgi:hypothetical protein